jgi:hypothetical protein
MATFVIEGFAGGNNVHQYLAVFGPPNDRGTAPGGPYFALSAITEIGDGCAVDLRTAHFSAVRPDFAVTVTFPTYVTEVNGYCGSKQRTYVLHSVDNATLKKLDQKQ